MLVRLYHIFSKHKLVYLLLVSAFFPYIQIIPLGSDTQPNTFLCACLFVFFHGIRKLNKELSILFLLALISLILLPFSGINFGTFRSVFNYMSLFIVTFAAYYGLKEINGIPFKLYRAVVVIWLIVGLIQLLIFPDFLSFLLPRGEVSVNLESGRGVISLAPEPTHYGLICILLGLIGQINFGFTKQSKIIYCLLLFQIFIVSRSSLAILIVVSAFFIFSFLSVLRYRKYRQKAIFGLFVFVALSVIGYANLPDNFADLRIGKLLMLFLENPSMILLADASVNERFVHLYFPIRGFIHDYGIPHGYSAFDDWYKECMKIPEINALVLPYSESNNSTRIQSGWGAILFEMGFFALLLIRVLYLLIKRCYNKIGRYVVGAIIIMVFLNAFPFSTPLASLFIANMMFVKYKKSDNQSI